MSRVWHIIRVYFRLLTQHLKAILEYQSDFWIAMCAAVLTQSLGIIFVWVIFEQIPTIEGWGFWEIVFLYSMVFISEGVSSFLFNGIWNINSLVNQGKMDVLLLRPYPLVLLVSSTAFGMNGVGNLMFGTIFFILAIVNTNISWSFFTVILLIVFVLSGVLIRVAVNLASNSFSFWSQGPRNSFPMMIHTVADFVKFPITIFTLAIQVFVSIAIPYAFISFYPGTYLFQKGEWSWLGLLSPFVALIAISIAILIFKLGVKKYESVGN